MTTPNQPAPKPVDKRARLLELLVDQKEDFIGARLDRGTIKALKADIDRMPAREVDRVLEFYEPAGPRCVW